MPYKTDWAIKTSYLLWQNEDVDKTKMNGQGRRGVGARAVPVEVILGLQIVLSSNWKQPQLVGFLNSCNGKWLAPCRST